MGTCRSAWLCIYGMNDFDSDFGCLCSGVVKIRRWKTYKRTRTHTWRFGISIAKVVADWETAAESWSVSRFVLLYMVLATRNVASSSSTKLARDAHCRIGDGRVLHTFDFYIAIAHPNVYRPRPGFLCAPLIFHFSLLWLLLMMSNLLSLTHTQRPF